jgi:triacylglycerol lipase
MTYYPNIPSEGVPYGQFGNQTFPDYGTQWRRVASITGDVLFIGPCRLFSKAQSTTTYRYRANLTDPTGQFPAMLGSTHAIEIGYVWNTPAVRTNSDLSRTVDFMSRAWVSFVVDLNPNNHGLSGIATWNKYSAAPQGQNFVIATNSFSTEVDTYRTNGINTINNAVLKL